MATVKVVKHSHGDPIKVKIVSIGEDLRVFVTQDEREARDSDFIWYLDEKAIRPDSKVYFVTSGQDLKIKYVEKKYYAKWVNTRHELQKRIG